MKGGPPSGGERWWRQAAANADASAVAVDLMDLPGPCGSKQLHLLPFSAQQPSVRAPFSQGQPHVMISRS